MKKKILAFALTISLLLCSCVRSNAQLAPVQTASLTAAVQNTARTGIRPEQFGAKGDGIADDQQALEQAMAQASTTGQPLVLTAGAVYRFTAFFEIPGNLTICGNGAAFLSDIQYKEQQRDRIAISIMGESNEERKENVRVENVVFRAAESCQSNYMLRIMRARNVVFTGCTFDCDRNPWNRCALDSYGANEGIHFKNCVFRQLTAGSAGGIWVRNWTNRVDSRDIRFDDCDFYKAGADEVLAVWGWSGRVTDVVISGCNFYEEKDPAYWENGYQPFWLITLGQSGTTDVRMENCTVDFDRCETLLRMVGDRTHAVVDNCDIRMAQPEDMAEHTTGVNPMVAYGNDRDDDSTVVQNCRITLSGDSGRRICYRLGALKNNTIEFEHLGSGITGTHEVTGNTLKGGMKRSRLYLDCDIVEKNTVVGWRALWPW